MPSAGSRLVVAVSSVAGEADQVCYRMIYFDYKFLIINSKCCCFIMSIANVNFFKLESWKCSNHQVKKMTWRYQEFAKNSFIILSITWYLQKLYIFPGKREWANSLQQGKPWMWNALNHLDCRIHWLAFDFLHRGKQLEVKNILTYAFDRMCLGMPWYALVYPQVSCYAIKVLCCCWKWYVLKDAILLKKVNLKLLHCYEIILLKVRCY